MKIWIKLTKTFSLAMPEKVCLAKIKSSVKIPNKN